jgi:carbonic anhydrase
MGAIDELVGRARARSRKPAGRPAEPRLRSVILTCMDARIDPVSLFGLSPGDVHVLRNAGARATPDVLRSLALSQAILGTREVIVLGHTACGLFGRTEAELSEAIRSKSGRKPGMELGVFKNLDEAVVETVAELRRCPFLAHRDRIQGFVYDLDVDEVRPVVGGESRETAQRSASPLAGLSSLRADVLDMRPNRSRKP